jgi:hypothetical protein
MRHPTCTCAHDDDHDDADDDHTGDEGDEGCAVVI